MSDESYFDQYDYLADMICDSPLIHSDLGMSNLELCGEICDLLDIEYFDLFEDLKPTEAEASDDVNVVRAHAMLYFLRYQVFTHADEAKVGLPEFNAAATAHSEMWYIRLGDRLRVMTEGGEPNRMWVN